MLRNAHVEETSGSAAHQFFVQLATRLLWLRLVHSNFYPLGCKAYFEGFIQAAGFSPIPVPICATLFMV